MMEWNKQIRRLAVVPILFITLGLISAPNAFADEQFSIDKLLDSPDYLEYLSLPEDVDQQPLEKPRDIELPEHEPAIVSFAKECASLNAIPLFDLQRDEDRRVFVGINFDGYLGIHGQL